jgi:hypothetical protein
MPFKKEEVQSWLKIGLLVENGSGLAVSGKWPWLRR